MTRRNLNILIGAALTIVLSVLIILLASCGGNPSSQAAATAEAGAQVNENTTYPYEFTAIAGAGNVRGVGGSVVYRVVDTDARVVCYFYSVGDKWMCLPFPAGAFNGE